MATALLSAVLHSRRNPSAYLYGLSFSLELPRPFITRLRLREMLDPKWGERVLEVGAGTDSTTASTWLGGSSQAPSTFWISSRRYWTRLLTGHTRWAPRTSSRSEAKHGGFPYPDNCFDAGYLNFVLGEILDRESALRELRRTLKPGGRLVIGEALTNPHMVRARRTPSAGGSGRT